MQDLRSVFRLDATPTLGTPVFALDYRAWAKGPPWWRRWLGAWRRTLRTGWRWLWR